MRKETALQGDTLKAHEKMERRPDHRRGHRHLGERPQRLHLREEQGETTSVDNPATSEAGRGRRRELELLHNHQSESQSQS